MSFLNKLGQAGTLAALRETARPAPGRTAVVVPWADPTLHPYDPDAFTQPMPTTQPEPPARSPLVARMAASLGADPGERGTWATVASWDFT